MAAANMSMAAVLLILGVLAVVGVVILVICLAVRGKNADDSCGTDGQGSYFDGSTIALIGWRILGGLLTGITLGIAFPWAMCMIEKWKAKHTVINGRRLKFNGNGAQLFGKYIIWVILTIVTLGIYSIWLGVSMEKWKVKHTVYADGKAEMESCFTGGAGGWFINHLVYWLLVLFTLGIATPWAEVRLTRWKASNTSIGGSPLVFNGTGGGLFVKFLLCILLTPLTLGIYALVYPVSLLKWQTRNTVALYRTAPMMAKSRAHEEAANKDFAKIRLAANDTELAAVKSGFTGNETPEELEKLVRNGNPYACYALGVIRKGESPVFEGEALELLRQASQAGYHPALFACAQYAQTPEEKIALLEESARRGNGEAPWLLARLYAEKANCVDGRLDMLTTMAYWFKVALELEDPQALAHQEEYDALLERLAILHCQNVCPPKGSVAVVIGAAIAGAVLLIAGVVLYMLFHGVALISEPKYVGHNDPLPVISGSAEYSRVFREELMRYDENDYADFDFVQGVQTHSQAVAGYMVELEYYMGDTARYDSREQMLYMDFGISENSRMDGSAMSVYLVFEDEIYSEATSSHGVVKRNREDRILVYPGERITQLPCRLPPNIERSTVHVILINSTEPQSAQAYSVWTADILEQDITILIDTEETVSIPETTVSIPETTVFEQPQTWYGYDVGTPIEAPTEEDIQLFYDMVYNIPRVWTSLSDSAYVFSEDIELPLLVERFVFDNTIGDGVLGQYNFNFVREYVQLDGDSPYCRYNAADVDWVLKAVFGREPEPFDKDAGKGMYYDGDYVYRFASETYGPSDYTVEILDFQPSCDRRDDGTYGFSIRMDTLPWGGEFGKKNYVLEFEAVPMKSADLGTYWRILSFANTSV